MEILFRFTIVSIFVLNIFVVSSTRADTVFFDDGGDHKVSDVRYQDDFVFLDRNTINNPGTHLELVDDGSIYYINAYHNSWYYLMILVKPYCVYKHQRLIPARCYAARPSPDAEGR